MPVRRDGKLYFRKCLEWVRQRYPLWRLNWYDRGVWRAQRILKVRETKRRGGRCEKPYRVAEP